MPKWTKLSLVLIFSLLQTQVLFAGGSLLEISPKTAIDDSQKILKAKAECEEVKYFNQISNLNINCTDHYFLFESNSIAKATSNTSKVKISHFNFLHPGTSKTAFKDYEIVAKMINKFDIVSANEILGIVGADLIFNRNLLSFLKVGPSLLAKYETELRGAKPQRANELTKIIKKLKEDLSFAPSLYKAPGYIQILKALRTQDSSWSFVLSPRGDSLQVGSVEEYVGFFFRKSKVSLAKNSYCSKSTKTVPACLISMRNDFGMGQVQTHFSRRPMIASFMTGKLQFNMLTSHVIFNSIDDEQRMSELLNVSFGTDEFDSIGLGINEVNYARWVEVDLISKWMNGFSQKFPTEKLLYAGDTNLEFSLDLWKRIVAQYSSDAVLEVSGKTTLSPRRLNSKNEETEGLSSSYDHFIFKKNDFKSCSAPQTFNFLNGEIANKVKEKYFIRDDLNLISENSLYRTNQILKEKPIDDEDDGSVDNGEIKLDYKLSKSNEKKLNLLLKDYEAKLSQDFVIKNNQIVIDEDRNKEKLEAYKVRVFMKQLTNAFFYKVFQEIISDHLPIYMECSVY